MRGLDQLPDVSVSETLAGGPGVIDLWHCFTNEVEDAEWTAAHEALLAPDEQARHRRFHFARDRHLFLVSRVLVRTVLSHYAPMPRAAWLFAAGTHGKPYVAHPAVAPRLHFNLAHTYGLVVCAVSVAHEPGVDVEGLDRNVEWLTLARHYFAPSEVAALQAQPPAAQSARFFSYWTLKESYIKARGLGLALPLDQFFFDLESDPIDIGFDARLADDAARWRFALFEASPHHLVAVGADTGGAGLSLRGRRLMLAPDAKGEPT
jgi:4'-phosphopantetheinyl transferase